MRLRFIYKVSDNYLNLDCKKENMFDVIIGRSEDELKKYGEGLDDKEETIIFTKTDMIDEKEVQKAIKKLNKYNKDILAVTVLDDDSIKGYNFISHH